MHVGKVEVFHAKPMHAVYHVENALLVVAVAVVFGDKLADFADGQFDAAARMHPGHAQYPRIGADVGRNAAQHFVTGNTVRGLEQIDAPDLGAFSLGTKVQHMVG
ncbi:hypothetical protein D3C77_671170 [compost metagenome]